MVEEARNGRTEWAWQAALADSMSDVYELA
jgi:hypothetical protein